MIHDLILDLDLAEYKDLLALTIAVELNPSSNRVKSNVGGFQSILFEPEDMPKELKKNLDIKVSNINDKVKLQKWWINVNGKGHANSFHSHHDKTLQTKEVGVSGVFYISIPEKNMGDIVFQDIFKRSNPLVYGYGPPKKFEPKQNMLLLFPSDFFHSVEPNQSDKKRISLAFNYTR